MGKRHSQASTATAEAIELVTSRAVSEHTRAESEAAKAVQWCFATYSSADDVVLAGVDMSACMMAGWGRRCWGQKRKLSLPLRVCHPCQRLPKENQCLTASIRAAPKHRPSQALSLAFRFQRTSHGNSSASPGKTAPLTHRFTCGPHLTLHYLKDRFELVMSNVVT
ncbi:hypothetical protein Micbo1qcDRAFT_171614 [Microdochium bolleyi]|uniref:Uncharacterized protein n=1 Tax=Microdochium bolleyi TaxID=196109 RepID=A0A136JDJ8_9PEZI|nr:hypothetical protein Micbo1qcDRAFT_171614 [Microdochium bolleyi]